jgi:hypothetical protein
VRYDYSVVNVLQFSRALMIMLTFLMKLTKNRSRKERQRENRMFPIFFSIRLDIGTRDLRGAEGLEIATPLLLLTLSSDDSWPLKIFICSRKFNSWSCARDHEFPLISTARTCPWCVIFRKKCERCSCHLKALCVIFLLIFQHPVPIIVDSNCTFVFLSP